MNTIAKIKAIAAKVTSPEFKQSLKKEISVTSQKIKAHVWAARWKNANQSKREALAWEGKYVVYVSGFTSLFDTWYITKDLLENLNLSEPRVIHASQIKIHPPAFELEQWEEHNLVKDTIIVDENNCFLYGVKAYREALAVGDCDVLVKVTNVRPIYPNL